MDKDKMLIDLINDDIEQLIRGIKMKIKTGTEFNETDEWYFKSIATRIYCTGYMRGKYQDVD